MTGKMSENLYILSFELIQNVFYHSDGDITGAITEWVDFQKSDDNIVADPHSRPFSRTLYVSHIP